MDERNDITLVVAADEDHPETVGVGKADRAVDQGQDDTPDHGSDEADGEPQGEVYAGPPPIPEPTLEDKDSDGRDKYANYEEFMSAHSRWTMDEATRRVDERHAAIRTHETISARHMKAITTYRRSHGDFDAALKTAKPVVAQLKKDLGPNALNVVDRYTVQDAENGPQIIHHLAEHPEELKRIAHLPPALQLAALGKLDAVVGRSTSSSRASGPGGMENAYDSDDYQEWKRERNEQEQRRRR